MHFTTQASLILLLFTATILAQWWDNLFSDFDINDISAISTKSLDTRCRSISILQQIINSENSTQPSDFARWLEANNLDTYTTIITESRSELAELQGSSELISLCNQAQQVQTTCDNDETANQNQDLCRKYIENRFSQSVTDAALNALGVSTTDVVVSMTVATITGGSPTTTLASTATPALASSTSMATVAPSSDASNVGLASCFVVGVAFFMAAMIFI